MMWYCHTKNASMVEIFEELCIIFARTSFFLKSINPISFACDYHFQLIQEVRAWLHSHQLLRDMVQQVYISEDISI